MKAIAADTNLLVRYLVCDDPDQARAARAVLEQAERVIIPTVVFCELAWVLKRSYALAAADIAQTIEELMESASVVCDEPVVRSGLKMLRRGRDFADGVVLEEARRAGAKRLHSFDRRFRELDWTGLVAAPEAAAES